MFLGAQAPPDTRTRWNIALCLCVPWLTHVHGCMCMCAMTHTRKLDATLVYVYVCHDSFAHVPWLTHTCVSIYGYVWQGSCGHAYVCITAQAPPDTRIACDLCVCVPWLIPTCAMTHAYVCISAQVLLDTRIMWDVDVCVCVPWLIRTWTMTHSYVCISALAPPDTRIRWDVDVNTQLRAVLKAFNPAFYARHTFFPGGVHLYVGHDTSARVPWLIHVFATTLS